MRLTKDWLTRRNSTSRWLWVLLPVYCLTCCRTSTISNGSVDQRALEAWKKHEAVVELAIKGKQNEEAFVEACLFFEQITGISIHVNIYTFGFIPEPEAVNDLELIRAWYKANLTRLYWDDAIGKVQVRLEVGGST